MAMLTCDLCVVSTVVSLLQSLKRPWSCHQMAHVDEGVRSS